jgi:hypothetical protein
MHSFQKGQKYLILPFANFFVMKTKLNRTKKPSKTAPLKKSATHSSLVKETKDSLVTTTPAPARSIINEIPVESKSAVVKKPAASKKNRKSNASSFLGFSGTASDEDESDDADSSSSSSSDSEVATKGSKNAGENKAMDSFALPDHSLDMEDDLNDDIIKNKNWDLAVGTVASKSNVAEDSDDDDDREWGAARMEAEANKQREAERKAREDKVRAQAELESKERLASAQATAELIRAKRMEEEEEEAKLKEIKDREAEEKRKEAREAVRRNVLETKQTVDLDATRTLMEIYERSLIDSEVGDSASPSYNFGF